MPGRVLLSTGYLPPVEYISRISLSGEALIEKEENYLKQTYRNRCYILTASGPQVLSVPVYLGSFHKTRIRDIRIDYSKRWQQVHLGAIVAAYNSSPFFIYYYDTLEKIIMSNHEYLLDLNMELLMALLRMMKLDIKISFTTEFTPVKESDNDLRYEISPKKRSHYEQKRYLQVFDTGRGFIPSLSIVDLIFNKGPDAAEYL